jgi:hypothetical protein
MRRRTDFPIIDAISFSLEAWKVRGVTFQLAGASKRKLEAYATGYF